LANLFFLLCEVFVVFYSGIPEHMAHFAYLYSGIDGHDFLVPWMWSALGLLGLAAILLLNPKTRRSDSILIVACIALFIGTWIDKGMGLIAGGFIPTPLHQVADYIPTALELLVSMGIYGIGAIILTILFKLVVGVRNENRGMTS
jgi:molybdopterin-containing oxidoreductase family membrane subunit